MAHHATISESIQYLNIYKHIQSDYRQTREPNQNKEHKVCSQYKQNLETDWSHPDLSITHRQLKLLAVTSVPALYCHPLVISSLGVSGKTLLCFQQMSRFNWYSLGLFKCALTSTVSLNKIWSGKCIKLSGSILIYFYSHPNY